MEGIGETDFHAMYVQEACLYAGKAEAILFADFQTAQLINILSLGAGAADAWKMYRLFYKHTDHLLGRLENMVGPRVGIAPRIDPDSLDFSVFRSWYNEGSKSRLTALKEALIEGALQSSWGPVCRTIDAAILIIPRFCVFIHHIHDRERLSCRQVISFEDFYRSMGWFTYAIPAFQRVLDGKIKLCKAPHCGKWFLAYRSTHVYCSRKCGQNRQKENCGVE